MADDEELKIYDDVPRSAAIVRTQDDARALAKKMAGEELPNECRFACVTCGWDKTLQFDEGEIAALGGDITSYGGPCTQCGSMTLIPHARLLGEDLGNVYAHAKKQRLEEYQEQATVLSRQLIGDVKKEIGGMAGEALGGTEGASIFSGPDQNPEPKDIHDPAGVQDYPDAGDVDTSELKPRQ